MASSRSQDRFGNEAQAPKPRSDAYTGLMAVSLVAMILGCVLLYLDYSQYPQSKPPAPPAKVQNAPPAGGAPANMP
jgi:hypothetical protein